MRILWMIFIVFTLSSANEVQRVDDILKEINQLRVDYKKSQDKIVQLEQIIKNRNNFYQKNRI
jgi:hypothetical protein